MNRENGSTPEVEPPTDIDELIAEVREVVDNEQDNNS
jgi:hypothetical protein